MSYATATKVPVDRTAAEIEQMIMKRKASNFARFSSKESTMIAFEMRLTVGEQTKPLIAAIYKGEPMQPLLPAPRKSA